MLTKFLFFYKFISETMRVALISLYNREFAFGLRYLSSFLKKEGFPTSIIFFKQVSTYPNHYNNLLLYAPSGFDEPWTEREMEIMLDLLEKLSPGLIGISLVSSHFELACEITRRIKKRMDTPIVWGGVHPTLCPEECIEHTDIVCVGEGEEAIVELADAISRGKDYTKIRNLWVRKKDGTIIKNELRPLIEDLDSLPFPDFDLEDKYYILNDSLTTEEPPVGGERLEYAYHMMTSRGCPFACAYCCNSEFKKIFKGKGLYVRRRSPENVVEEIEKFMEKRRIEIIHFWDDVFTFDEEWVERFKDVYSERIALPFVCYAHPAYTSKRVLKLLRDAGLIIVNLGIQSGSDRTNLYVYHRAQRAEDVIKGSLYMKELGLIRHYDLILDSPFEDDEDHRQTLELMLSLPRPFLLNTHSMCYFPKAEVTVRALKEGLITPEEVEGNAHKSTTAFLVDVTRPQPKLNLFWNILIGMTRYRVFPSWFIRLCSRNRFLRNHPGLMVPVVVNVVRILTKGKRIRDRYVRWRERRRRKKMEGFPIEVREENGTWYVTLRNPEKKKKRIMFSLDIYPLFQGRHPDRHLGWWNIYIDLPADGKKEIKVDYSFPFTVFEFDGKRHLAEKRWVGDFRDKETWYRVGFIVYSENGKLLGAKEIRVSPERVFEERRISLKDAFMDFLRTAPPKQNIFERVIGRIFRFFYKRAYPKEHAFFQNLPWLLYMMGEMEEEFKKLKEDVLSYSSAVPREEIKESIYKRYEEIFREEDETRGKMKEYVKYFRGKDPVLDAGCGKGEFLEILDKEGINAYGVEKNPVLFNHCINRGLKVEKGDVIEHLSSLENQSLGGIFASHLLEHLYPREVSDFIRLSYAKLKPGGVLVIELPNPSSLYSLLEFHRDLTHKTPLHPETVKFLVEDAGFKIKEFSFINPPEECLRLLESTGDDDKKLINKNFELLNKLLFGGRDFFLVAEKEG